VGVLIQGATDDSLGSRNSQPRKLSADLFKGRIPLRLDLVSGTLKHLLRLSAGQALLLFAIALSGLTSVLENPLPLLPTLIQRTLHLGLLLQGVLTHPIRFFKAFLDLGGPSVENSKYPLIREEIQDDGQDGEVDEVDKQTLRVYPKRADAACFFSYFS